MEEEYQSKAQDVSQLPLNDLAQGLFSNPEMLQKIGGILKAISSSSPTSEADISSTLEASEAPIKERTAIPTPDPISGDGLASLLSNPEILEKLPSMLAAMKPMLSSLSSHSSPSLPRQKEELLHRSASDCRNDLLLSLKPFLSHPRQDAVDAILRIAKLGVLLGQIK